VSNVIFAVECTAVDFSQAPESRGYPCAPSRTWSIAPLFPSLIRGEEAHSLASRKKRRARTSAPPGRVSRLRWPGKYVLVSKRLDALEKDRGNTVVSRNLRLTAIRSFYRVVALRDPVSVGIATRVLAIPLKRANARVREYLTREELEAILASKDPTHWCGRRDYALLLTMYNLGARVSEVSGLRQSHVIFCSKTCVQLHGKGRKDRSIPLWPRTARVLKDLFRDLGQQEQRTAFPGIRGEPLTRFAIHLLLRKAVGRASARCPTLTKKRVCSRVVRHGTAMALLESGADIAVIALWLGHESIETSASVLGVALTTTAGAHFGCAPHFPRSPRCRGSLGR
jgi:integrase/recombinase XerD